MVEAKKEGRLKKFVKYLKEKKLEVLVAVFLGITTLLSAWAGWIGSLHSGIQAINFTQSNNLMAEGNAAYNVAAQVYIADVFNWNTILGLQADLDAAKQRGDTNEAKIIEAKLEKIKHGSCSPMLQEAMNTKSVKEGASPFDNAEYTASYFTEAKALLDKAQKTMEEGKQDNLRGDSFQLVSVFYSLVLFLLGIVGVLKDYQSRKMLFIFSVVILVFAIIYMLTLPMPTGFDITSFFKAK